MQQAVNAVADTLREMGIASRRPGARAIRKDGRPHGRRKHHKEHPALAAVRKSGAAKVKVAVQRHRRHPARQVPAQGQVLRRGRQAASASATWCSAGTRTTSCYDNTTVTGWQHGFPDALARLDLDTARHVPWDGGVPFFLGEFVNADGTPVPGVPAPDPEARAEARREARLRCRWPAWSSSGSTSSRRRRAGPTRRASGPTNLTPGMFGYSLLRMNQQPRVLQRADGRDARLRRADRGPAHRDRPRRLRGRDRLQRGAGAGRPRDPVQDRRQGDRPALRHHAQLHGQVEPAVPGLQRPHPPEPVATARPTCSTTPRARAR